MDISWVEGEGFTFVAAFAVACSYSMRNGKCRPRAGSPHLDPCIAEGEGDVKYVLLKVGVGPKLLTPSLHSP